MPLAVTATRGLSTGCVSTLRMLATAADREDGAGVTVPADTEWHAARRRELSTRAAAHDAARP